MRYCYNPDRIQSTGLFDMIMKRIIFFLVLITSSFATIPDVYSQKFLIINSTGEIPSSLSKRWPSKNVKDSLDAIRSLNRLLANMFDNGYLEANIDSLYLKTDTLFADLHLGTQFKWVKLLNSNIDEGWLSEAGFRDRFFENKPVSPVRLRNINTRILNWCENNGYPFASIRYGNFQFDDGKVSADVILDTERMITIDSVIVMGDPKLSTVYISNYIGVKRGDLYNESVIRKIPGRIKELPMVTETRAFNIAFTENTARVILYLQDKKASQIDGVVGILPDNNNTGKVQLTGDLRLRLLSSFGRGELFDLNWKQPRSKTQDLKVNLNYPFILNTPFGIDLKLAIYKFDSSYVETTLGAGIQFLLRQGSFLKLFVDDKNSSLLSTKQYENAIVLPPFADIRKTTYGAGLKFIDVDYRLSPSKGYIIDFSAGAGNRNIRRNGNINPEVYDSLDLKSLQYNGEIAAEMFVRILPKFILNPGIKTGGLGGSSAFDNELYRLGGLNSLRGFDEESITASLYGIGKIELRYVLEQNSFLQLFFNGAWYERNSNSGYVNDTPLGFGAGITFDTRLGIFSFNYALGKEFSNTIQFRAAKIHFGLVNYF